MEDQDEAALRALGIDPADVANAEASRSIKTGDPSRGEPSSVLAYQDSVCLKEQITCRQL